MERSRYTTYSTTRLPRRKKTIRLPGSFEDKGKYIRCWNCGFIVNVERDLGNSETSGNYETDAVAEELSPVGTGDDPIIVLETLNQVGAVIANGPSGDPVTDYYTARVPQVSHGCPMCGCAHL